MPFNYEAASTLCAMLELGLDHEPLALEVAEQFQQSVINDRIPEVRNLFFVGLIAFWFGKRELTIESFKVITMFDKERTMVGTIYLKEEVNELLKLLKNNHSIKFTKKSVEICKVIFLEMKDLEDSK